MRERIIYLLTAALLSLPIAVQAREPRIAAPTSLVMAPPDGYVETLKEPGYYRVTAGVFEYCTNVENSGYLTRSKTCSGQWVSADQFVKKRTGNPGARYVGMGIVMLPTTDQTLIQLFYAIRK